MLRELLPESVLHLGLQRVEPEERLLEQAKQAVDGDE